MAFYPELAIAQWIFKPALQFIDYTENDVQNIGWTKKKNGSRLIQPASSKYFQHCFINSTYSWWNAYLIKRPSWNVDDSKFSIRLPHQNQARRLDLLHSVFAIFDYVIYHSIHTICTNVRMRTWTLFQFIISLY